MMCGMTTRRQFLRSTLYAGAAVLLAACGGGSSTSAGSAPDAEVQKAFEYAKANMPAVTLDLLKAAKAEGKFVFYHGQTGSDDAMLAEFRKQFPFINVESVTLSGGNLVERFNSEYKAGKYLVDVVSITSLPAAAQAQKDGFVMAYTPGPASEIPPSHTVPGYVHSHYSSVMGIGWNPDKIKDAEAKAMFAKWDGLGDARLQGKKYALNSDISGGSLQVLYTFEYKQFGTSLWQKMASSYNLYPGSPPIADAIISGEADVAAGLSAETMEAKWDKGAPIHWAYPEPVLALPLVEFIAAKAPNPNAAKVFTEYLFSLRSLATYVAQGGLPDRKGVPDNRKIKSEPWFSPPDTAKVWSYTTDDIRTTFPEVAKAWNGIFKK
jgi:iron(III) transport system substrate-binding protein